MKRAAMALVTTAATLGLTGCNPYTGMNSLPLPGTEGTGSDSYQIKVQLRNADDLVANTPVFYKDMNVGTTTHVGLENGWTPMLTVSIRKDITLPANATAALAQTSLLGSKHIDLIAPAGAGSQGELQPGAVITEDRVKQFPETEDLLAGVSALLNGGGLQHFQTITTELNRALGNGRDKDARELLTQLNNFTDGIDKQTADITAAMHGFDNLATSLQPRMADIDKGLAALPAGLDTFTDLEPQLIDALDRLGKANKPYASVAVDAIDDLRAEIKELKSPLRHIGDIQPGSLPRALRLLPYAIFTVDSLPYAIRGDYVNLNAPVNLTLDSLDKNLFGGTPLSGSLYSVAQAMRNFRLPGAKTANSLPLADPLQKVVPLPGPLTKSDKPLPGPLSDGPLAGPIAPRGSDAVPLPSLPKLGK
jgi:phospholipid/cholesterol/gamma-HCH transport system substrate-binding protein